MNGIFKYKSVGIGALIGGVLGYAYYYFVGCNSGSCPISSNPVVSTIYVGFMGALMGITSRKSEV